MAYLISTGAHYHWVRKITASTHGNGALKLTLHGDKDASDIQFNEAEITVFTEDEAMVDRLIEAINGIKPTPTVIRRSGSRLTLHRTAFQIKEREDDPHQPFLLRRDDRLRQARP